MGNRLQAKDADHRATFVVHHKLVDGAFEAIDLLLNCCYDILNLGHAFCRSCRRQINPQADKHDRQRSNLRGKRSLLDSQVRNNTLWNALLEHGLDSAEDLSFKLRSYFHARSRDLDPICIINASQIDQVEPFRSRIEQFGRLEEFSHVLVTWIRCDNFAASRCHSF